METPDGRVIDQSAWIRAGAVPRRERHASVYPRPPRGRRGSTKTEKPRSLRIYEARGHVVRGTPSRDIPRVRGPTPGASPIWDTTRCSSWLSRITGVRVWCQVTNFFAPARRNRSPKFGYLVDKAHGLGMHVFMDVVHAHASDNVIDGLNEFGWPAVARPGLVARAVRAHVRPASTRRCVSSSNLRYWSRSFASTASASTA